MTTNLKIAYPDMPFNALSITSSETYSTDYPVLNLVNGSRGKRAELATAFTGQHEIEFDLGSGINQACDYVALGDAKIFKKSGVTQFQLKGSSASYRAPSSISGLIAWFDPTKDVTYDSLRRISQVSDQSGNNNHATQSTDANKPVYSRADNKENQFLYSDDQSNAAYTSESLTSATYGSTDYLGNSTATRLLCAAASSRHRRYQSGYATRPAGTQYTFSVDVKKDNYNTLWIGDAALFSWHGAGFNVNTGAFTGNETALNSKSVQNLGNGWYRVTITYTASSSGNPAPSVYFEPTGASQPNSFVAAGTEAVYTARWSFREGAADSDHITTTDYRQFRGINGNRCMVFDGSNDHLTANGVAASITGDDKAFTISMIIRQAVIPTVGDSTPISFGRSSSATPYIWLTAGGASGVTYYFDKRDDASGTATRSGGTPDTSIHVLTWVYTGTTASFYIDGVAAYTAQTLNTGTLTLDRMGIGALVRNTISNYLNGKIGDLIVFNTALSDANRESVEAYLTSKWSTSAAATIDIENLDDFTGGQERDYIQTFTETSAYRYWIAQIESDTATTRPLSKLYFGKLFDLEREPQFERSVTSERSDKQIYEKNKFSLNYQGISTNKRLEFEEKIGQYSDSNEVFLYTNSYNAVMLGTSLISCAIKDYSFESKGAKQNSLTIDLEETY
jgi:hypothetical protein